MMTSYTCKMLECQVCNMKSDECCWIVRTENLKSMR